MSLCCRVAPARLSCGLDPHLAQRVRTPRHCLAVQVLKLDTKMLELAEQLKDEQSLLVFGRGYNYATALEAALKVGSWATW